jgi:hypothetical protein
MAVGADWNSFGHDLLRVELKNSTTIAKKLLIVGVSSKIFFSPG